jgi:transcriptional regulator with XRE-family HTH domain
MREANSTDKHVGNRIRTRRLMLNMSQATLASTIGVTFQQVQKYEKGSNRVSASRLLQIASALQVPIDFFFEGLPHPDRASGRKDDESYDAYVSDFFASSDGPSLAKAFVQIRSPKVRRCIVGLIQEIAAEAK